MTDKREGGLYAASRVLVLAVGGWWPHQSHQRGAEGGADLGR